MRKSKKTEKINAIIVKPITPISIRKHMGQYYLEVYNVEKDFKSGKFTARDTMLYNINSIINEVVTERFNNAMKTMTIKLEALKT